MSKGEYTFHGGKMRIAAMRFLRYGEWHMTAGWSFSVSVPFHDAVLDLGGDFETIGSGFEELEKQYQRAEKEYKAAQKAAP